MVDKRYVATVAAKGRIYSAWESILVRRDFKNGISTFQFTPTEGAYGKNFAEMQLQPGDPVKVSLGGQLALTGFVCTRSVAYDALSHQIVIAGRSQTADVHDSSLDIKPGTLDGSTFEQAARKALQPHGVGLVMRNPPPIASKPFKFLMPQFGETGGEFIGRLAAMRGLFLCDDASGSLVAGCGEPGAAPVAELIEGRNILRASALIDDQSAFGKYSTVGQTPGPGQDAPPRWYSSSATDGGVRQNRSKLQIAEHPIEADELAARNNFEVANGLWENVQAAITVVGWFKPDGRLWEPAENVSVYSPMIFPIDGGRYDRLGIQSVAFAQDSENGTTTTLNLVLSSALTSIPTKGLDDLGGTGDAGQSGGGAPPTSQSDAPDYLAT